MVADETGCDSVKEYPKGRKAAAGFEPANNGFAIRPLEPLGYAAVDVEIKLNDLTLLPIRIACVKHRPYQGTSNGDARP